MLLQDCSVWASSKQLSLFGSPVFLSKSLWSLACPKVTLRRPTVYILLDRERPTEYGQFRGLPQAILTCLLPVVMNFWAGLIMSPLLRSFSLFHLLVNILSVKELSSKVEDSLCPRRNCYITASITDHITDWTQSLSSLEAYNLIAWLHGGLSLPTSVISLTNKQQQILYQGPRTKLHCS